MNTVISTFENKVMYKAGDDLAEILFRHGFIETTSKLNIKKGKRSFRKSKTSPFEIYFNYSILDINRGFRQMDSCYEMTEQQLKYLLFYFTLKSNDKKLFDPASMFSFDKMKSGFEAIQNEIEDLKTFKIRPNRLKRLEKIFREFKGISILLFPLIK